MHFSAWFLKSIKHTKYLLVNGSWVESEFAVFFVFHSLYLASALGSNTAGLVYNLAGNYLTLTEPNLS